MASSSIEISLIGSSIAIKRLKGNTGSAIGNEPIDYFPVAHIKGVTSTGVDARQDNAGANATSYEYFDQLMIHLEFVDVDAARISFDIQSVTNQVLWTPDQAGLLLALSDINGWIASAGGGGTSIPLTGVQSRIVADYVEVNTLGVPTASTGIFRNINVIKKYTEDLAGVETLVGYFDYSGAAYTVVGTIKDMPEELCCEDWCEDVPVNDLRLVAYQPHNSVYLSNPADNFQLGIALFVITPTKFEINGIQQGALPSAGFALDDTTYLPVQAAIDDVTPAPVDVALGTTENNWRNMTDYLAGENTVPNLLINPYMDSTLNAALDRSCVAFDINSNQDFDLVVEREDIISSELVSYRYLYNATTGVFQAYFEYGSTLTPSTPLYSRKFSI